MGTESDDAMELLPAAGPIVQSSKDFKSDQMVRWCPGCGDFAILASVQKMLPTLNIPKEKYVFVSGIGCSSRFPYYMNTYGFHTIHGRALTLATGIKGSNPDLQVWVVTGDGDCLSIGGNHLLHALRRNVDVKILLFNNRIYGLTKGQYSPTSELGKKTKSSPMGSVDTPINPLAVALASDASFVARAVDTDLPFLGEILTRAAHHKGSAFIEIFQNCVVFNDGSFDAVAAKEVRDEKMLKVAHGKPMIFGAKKDKGIVLNGFEPEVITFDPANPPKNILLHDEKAPSATLANFLAHMAEPVPQGIFRDVSRPALHERMNAQIDQAKKEKPADLQKLLKGSETWAVTA
ncbi:MAG: 2-oxoacid:ferredoxin oxidoreductase subunit beta [Elusimicrobia bacterium CG11_big_fil_rev_8_21_14_0_20_64_6]|nr:MAG: 2-oxoacid:ferredoxin oxidoreductase subunit beta [Elusimicrobia bacterium CG11_big_fil_rev_8_21_14_0_20_64_6]